jgi:hypothetical protein
VSKRIKQKLFDAAIVVGLVAGAGLFILALLVAVAMPFLQIAALIKWLFA